MSVDIAWNYTNYPVEFDGWLLSADSLVGFMPGQVEERITGQHRLWNGHADYFT